jgi:hypothetical protein
MQCCLDQLVHVLMHPQDILGCMTDYIRAQNALVCRVAFLLVLCTWRGVYFIVEQPEGSVMWRHPVLERVLAMLQVSSATVQLGSFGLECPKPVRLTGGLPLEMHWAARAESSANVRVSSHGACLFEPWPLPIDRTHSAWAALCKTNDSYQAPLPTSTNSPGK